MQSIHYQAAKSLILFLAAVTLFTACSPPGPRALLQGKKLLEEQKYGQAVEKLRKAVVLLGNTNAHAFNYLGLACHEAGLFAEAEKSYQRALALNRDLTEAHYNYGCLLLSENKPDQAKAELTAYSLRRGNSADAWLKLAAAELRLSSSGSAYSRGTELGAAEKSFNEALRLSPQNPEALNGLGLVRLRRNRVSEATNLFSRALLEQADYRPALLNLAIVAQQYLNDPQLALRTYREYLSLKPLPENAEAIRTIVHQLEEQPMPPAHAAVSNAIPAQANTNATAAKPSGESARAVPPPKLLETNLARLAISPRSESTNTAPKPTVLTNTPKAATPASPPPPARVEAVQLAPEPQMKLAQDVSSNPSAEPEPKIQSAPSGSSRIDNTGATKSPKRGLLQRLNPLNLFGGDGKTASNPTPLPSIQPTNIDTGKDMPEGTSQAIARYTYALPPKPEAGNRSKAEREFAKGAQAQRSDQLTEALQDYQRAIELDPSFYDSYYNLALAASEAGNSSLALLAYETALTLRPESLDARYNFALTLRQANFPIDAANELEKLIAAHPSESRAHLALGNLFSQQLHDTAKARKEYLKVLDSDPQNPQADAIRHWLTAHPR